jgi:plasmid maintenance system antidote protein VapI
MHLKSAAKLSVIPYSALRSFLNCETALTPDMAARLEWFFTKANQHELLDMQSRYDAKCREVSN